MMWSQKLETNHTPHDDSSGLEFKAIVADVTDQLTPANTDFLVSSSLMMCLHAWIQMFLNKSWSWVVWGMVSVRTSVGLVWYGGQCQYVQVFIFSLVMTFVSNSSIRAAILIPCLGYVNPNKFVNVNMIRLCKPNKSVNVKMIRRCKPKQVCKCKDD